MDQLLRAFAGIPLQMAQEARAIIDEADQQRFDPLATAGEDFARAMMEVQMQQLQNMFDFVAAHFALLEAIAGGERAVGGAFRRALTPQSLSFQIAPYTRIG